MITREILDLVFAERKRQDAKWGPQSHSMPEWISILTEEVGEAAMKANHFHFAGPSKGKATARDAMIVELVQVAAVAIAMAECADHGIADVEYYEV